MDLLSELFAVNEVNTDTFEDAGDNVGFIDCFKMPIWTSFSPEKRLPSYNCWLIMNPLG